MKNSFSLFIILIACLFSCKKEEQQSINPSSDYLSVLNLLNGAHDFDSTEHIKRYELLQELKMQLDDENNIITQPPDLINLIGGKLKLCESDLDANIKWQNLGPIHSELTAYQNQGRVECVSVNPNDHGNILAGGNNGGIWITRDTGKHWTNTTDENYLSMVGINDIVRHPKNPLICYAATSSHLNRWNAGDRGYGLGLLISVDGGAHWDLTSYQRDYGSWYSATQHIAIDPRSTEDSTIIFLATPSKIIVHRGDYSIENNWETLYNDGKYYNGPTHYGPTDNHDLEVEFDGTIWFANHSGIYSWSPKDPRVKRINNYNIPTERNNELTEENCSFKNPVNAKYDIEINKAGDIVFAVNFYYYRILKNGKCQLKSKPYYYYKSTDRGNSWTEPQKSYSSGYKYPQIGISAYNSNVIYFENSSRLLSKSLNLGKSKVFQNTSRFHVDVRDIDVVSGIWNDSTGKQDLVFICNDGGISYTKDGTIWKDITGSGLVNTNFFGLAITEADPEYIALGAQDGNANFYDQGNWYTTAPGGDNGDCLIDPTNKELIFQSANGRMYKGNMQKHKYRGKMTKKVLGGYQLFPMHMNALNKDKIYAGGKELYYSKDLGKIWRTISARNTHEPKRINDINTSNQNEDLVFYCTNGHFWNKKAKAMAQTNAGGIYKAELINDVWSVTDITSNLRDKCAGTDNCGLRQMMTSLAVDKNDDRHILVSFAGFSKGKKIFETKNGGDNWSNISDCMPNVPVTKVAYDEINQVSYAGTDIGVFFKTNDDESWTPLGDDGPKCMVSDIEINRTTKQILVSTLGRGLWRANLVAN